MHIPYLYFLIFRTFPHGISPFDYIICDLTLRVVLLTSDHGFVEEPLREIRQKMNLKSDLKATENTICQKQFFSFFSDLFFQY